MPAYENPADFALEVASMPDGPNDPAEMWDSFVRQRFFFFFFLMACYFFLTPHPLSIPPLFSHSITVKLKRKLMRKWGCPLQEK